MPRWTSIDLRGVVNQVVPSCGPMAQCPRTMTTLVVHRLSSGGWGGPGGFASSARAGEHTRDERRSPSSRRGRPRSGSRCLDREANAGAQRSDRNDLGGEDEVGAVGGVPVVLLGALAFELDEDHIGQVGGAAPKVSDEPLD